MSWNVVTPENKGVELKANHNQKFYVENQVNYAACFVVADPLLELVPCALALLEAGHEIVSRQQNVF